MPTDFIEAPTRVRRSQPSLDAFFEAQRVRVSRRLEQHVDDLRRRWQPAPDDQDSIDGEDDTKVQC